MQSTLIILVMISLTSYVGLTNTYAENESKQFDKIGTQWNTLQWSVENPTFKDNPYDLVATVRFVHSESGEQHTTEMFYDGENTWKFRFNGTRPGNWLTFIKIPFHAGYSNNKV